jgi:hypothetical protein
MNEHTCCHRWTSASVDGVERGAERQPTANGGGVASQLTVTVGRPALTLGPGCYTFDGKGSSRPLTGGHHGASLPNAWHTDTPDEPEMQMIPLAPAGREETTPLVAARSGQFGLLLKH